MDKVLDYSKIVAYSVTIIGAVMKLFTIPRANILLIVGITAVVICHLISIAMDYSKGKETEQ